MREFKVGDKVVCNRPVETMLKYKGITAFVIRNDRYEGGDLIYLSEPFGRNGAYTAEQFDLVKPLQLTNK